MSRATLCKKNKESILTLFQIAIFLQPTVDEGEEEEAAIGAGKATYASVGLEGGMEGML